jgi:hypothetical protein
MPADEDVAATLDDAAALAIAVRDEDGLAELAAATAEDPALVIADELGAEDSVALVEAATEALSDEEAALLGWATSEVPATEELGAPGASVLDEDTASLLEETEGEAGALLVAAPIELLAAAMLELGIESILEDDVGTACDSDELC